MMQLTRTASLLVVLLLLGSVATASAECAWVLWYSPNAPESWVREDAFESRATCVRTLDRNQRQYGEARVQRASETVLVIYPTPGVSGTASRLDCLPDTVDPRGPKGK